MTVSIRSIETAVPNTVLKQHEIRDIFASQPGISRLGRRRITAVYDASAIDTRHTVLDELGSPSVSDTASHFFDRAAGTIKSPSTGVRNRVYAEQSPGLFLEAAVRAVQAAPGITAADITHVVTVSCTGFFAPGPDYALVRGLGLAPSTERYHLGFMGCYGAFPALRAARSFCCTDPGAVVLVVCAELCTIHLASSDDPDTIVASSVFADGAAAAVVSARLVPAGESVLDLDVLQTTLTPVGETDMTWTIGDAGFEMRLSSYVPRIIEQHIRSALTPLLATDAGLSNVAYADIPRWAVHPGGRSILDKVQRTLELRDDQLEASREVLREYGNMSSSTVLFVLQRILQEVPSEAAERVCAMAFGPGLTVETALLTRRTA